MKHPARFSAAILDVLASQVGPTQKVLDPFAGTGQIHLLGCHTFGIEIEPEWAAMKPADVEGFNVCGNALALPFPDDTFDVIATSPCYGNRFADHHNAKDPSTRRSYTHDLRAATDDNERTLHSDNSGTLRWGQPYRDFHRRAWTEAIRVLRPQGRFLLNVKDHIRRGERVRVCDWHRRAVGDLGLTRTSTIPIRAPGLRYGENSDARTGNELVYVFTKERP